MLRVLTSVDLIDRQTLPIRARAGAEEGHVRRFYRGFKPTWRDVVDHVPAPLAAADEFSRLISDNIARIRESSDRFVIACYGPAGSGKTTLLMQTAFALAEGSRPVYFIRGVPDSFLELVAQLDKIAESGYLLFTDKLDLIADEIDESVGRGLLRNAIIIGSERQNVWHHRTKKQLGRYVYAEQALSTITRDDAEKILGRLGDFGPWTRLASLTDEERVQELLYRWRRQLLIGLLETTQGIGFEDIIDRDYRHITDPSDRLFLLITGLATIHRLRMPLSIAMRAMQAAGVARSLDSIYTALSGIMLEREGEIEARHPVYVRELLERSVHTDDLRLAVVSTLRAFASHGSPVLLKAGRKIGTVFIRIINHRFLLSVFKKNEDLVLGIYHEFERVFESDGVYWQHFGLALRGIGRQEEALEKLRTAFAAYPSDHTQHSLGQQYLLVAMESTSEARARSLLDEAAEQLRTLKQISPEQDNYPAVTLAEGHTAVIKRIDGDEAARRIARCYANELSEHVKTLPHDERLRTAYQRLATYAATGVLGPKAADAAEG